MSKQEEDLTPLQTAFLAITGGLLLYGFANLHGMIFGPEEKSEKPKNNQAIIAPEIPENSVL